MVIGGSGYIGANLVPLLVASGRCVTVLGRSLIPQNKLPNGVIYMSGDFSEKNTINRLLEKHQEVIHLAYATVPNTSFKNPITDLMRNLPPTVQLFSLAAKKEVKLILVSSGGTVYGESNGLPIYENNQTKPISPYGVTKLTLENYAHLFATTHGLKFICVRPANVYGVGQWPFSGQGFIATAMASAMVGVPVNIFGKSGTTRDYIYISDVARGIVCTLLKGRLSETYNLGSGIGLNNLEIIQALRPLMSEIGCHIEVKNLPKRKFDVKSNILDSKKLQKDTGWRPLIGFDKGLLKTRKWLVKRLL